MVNFIVMYVFMSCSLYPLHELDLYKHTVLEIDHFNLVNDMTVKATFTNLFICWTM